MKKIRNLIAALIAVLLLGVLTGCPAPASNVEENKGILETYAPELLNRTFSKTFSNKTYDLTFSSDDTYVFNGPMGRCTGKIQSFRNYYTPNYAQTPVGDINGNTLFVTWWVVGYEDSVEELAICYSNETKTIGFYDQYSGEEASPILDF